MPSFTPRYQYNLSTIQVDLIIYALQRMAPTMTDTERDEMDKILEALYNNRVPATTYNPHSEWDDDPICDI